MCLLCINEMHVTNTKVTECHEGTQVSVAMVHLLLLLFGLPYMWRDSCLHRPVAFWVEPGFLVIVIANEYLYLIVYYNTKLYNYYNCNVKIYCCRLSDHTHNAFLLQYNDWCTSILTRVMVTSNMCNYWNVVWSC